MKQIDQSLQKTPKNTDEFIPSLRLIVDGLPDSEKVAIGKRIEKLIKDGATKNDSIIKACWETFGDMPSGIVDHAAAYAEKIAPFPSDKRFRFWRMAAGYCRRDRGFGVEVNGLPIGEALEKAFNELDDNQILLKKVPQAK